MSAPVIRDVIQEVTNSDQFKRHSVLKALIQVHRRLLKLTGEMSDWDRDEIGGVLWDAGEMIEEQITYLARELHIEVSKEPDQDLCESPEEAA